MTVGRDFHKSLTGIWWVQRRLGVKPADCAGFLMRSFPRLRPKLHLLPVVTAVDAVYVEEHRRIAIFAIGHREAEFRMRHDNVAVVYHFNAKGHDTPHGHAANAAPFSTWRALRTSYSLILCFDRRSLVRKVKT